MRTFATKQPTNNFAKQKKKLNKTRSRSVSPLSTGMPLLQRKCACGGGCPRCREALEIQTKLKISEPGDKYEQEADRIADQVMRMPDPSVQRQVELEEEEEILQRKAIANQLSSSTLTQESSEVHPIVREVLNSPGQPLDPKTRTFMESRFGHDFNQVRIHTDTKASESAQTINASAYAVKQDVVFGAGQYIPHTAFGKRLLAHELTHVIQQKGTFPIKKTPVTVNAEAATSMISRADQDVVSDILNLGSVAGSGILFWPTNVTDTRVGPVSVRGGLLSSQTSQLNVIIGENLTLRTLARQILPLWTTATPFTLPGTRTTLPLDSLNDLQLAQGLLVYNQTYLPIPAMTQWRVGLRFPLPVEIDVATGVATLHPMQIRQLASAFNPAWERFLYLHAGATTTTSTATIQADVAEFLGQETTALARGIHLGAKALTNAVAELSFIRETFVQLGTDAFEVALAFMNNLVNHEIELLAAQRDGAAILGEISTALGTAPTPLSADRQRHLDRANIMLERVTGISSLPPPAAIPSHASELVWRPSRNGNPCACLVFIHNNEHNARSVAETLHQRCRYNLASIEQGTTRQIPILGRPGNTIDPNELFPQDIQTECTQNESSCREYILNHSDIRAMRMQFFLAIKDCSDNFSLPTVALHNNTIRDTASFRRAIPRMGNRLQRLVGDINRSTESGEGSIANLRSQLRNLVRGRNFGGLLTRSGTTNIFRWCNLPEIGRCHIGDPAHPDHVIWTTNVQEYDRFAQTNVNVVLQTTSGPESGESATDLSTLFLRLGPNTHFINIETPGTPRNATEVESATQFVSENLRQVGLDCCDS